MRANDVAVLKMKRMMVIGAARTETGAAAAVGSCWSRCW